MINKLEESWLAYKKEVIDEPENMLTDTQVAAVRDTFYAGAISALTAITDLGVGNEPEVVIELIGNAAEFISTRRVMR